MSERQETGISGVDSCSEYVENRGLLGGFSLLSSETEDMGSRAVFESTLLTEPIGADKISPFRSFPSLSSIHSLSPGSSKFIPQPKHSTQLAKTSTRLPKTSTPVPETSTPVPKTSTSVSKTSTPLSKTLSVSSSILHPTYQKTLLPLNIANNNKKRGRKLMTKKNVGSIKLMNCQVTLRRMRSENYSEHLMTDQSEGNTQNGVIVEALNDGSIVESKRKRSKRKATWGNYDEETEFPVPISPVLKAETANSSIPIHQFCKFCEVRSTNLDVHLHETHVMLVDGKEVCGFCRTMEKPPVICLKAHMRSIYRIQYRQQSKPGCLKQIHTKRLSQCKSPKSRKNVAPKKCAKKQKTMSNKLQKEEYQDVMAFSDLMEISDFEDSSDSSGSEIDEIGVELFSPSKFLEVVSDLDLRVCKFIQFKSSKLSSYLKLLNSFLLS